MQQVYDAAAPKKPTNLSVNSDLLAKAKSLNINCSAVLEQALEERVRAAQQALWKKENARSLENYNKFVEENEIFSDSTRKF